MLEATYPMSYCKFFPKLLQSSIPSSVRDTYLPTPDSIFPLIECRKIILQFCPAGTFKAPASMCSYIDINFIIPHPKCLCVFSSKDMQKHHQKQHCQMHFQCRIVMQFQLMSVSIHQEGTEQMQYHNKGYL